MDSYMLNIIQKLSSKPILPLFRLSKSVVNDKIASITSLDLKSIHPSYESYMMLEVAKDCKETICQTSDTMVNESDPRFANLPLVPYELPDGTVVDVGMERLRVPELFFDPSSLDWNHSDMVNCGLASSSASPSGLPQLVVDSVLRCEPDLQATLISNMVLAGGNSCYDNLQERLKAEVELLVCQSAPSWKVRVASCAPAERPLCCWLGGSVLASLGSFHEMWMSKQEYEEYGVLLVDKKCP